MKTPSHALSRLRDGTPGYSSTKLIICTELSTLTAWTVAHSPHSTIGGVFGKASRFVKSSKTWQALQAFADEAFSLRTRSVDRAKDVELYLNFQHWVESSAFFHLTMSGVLEPPIVSRSYDGNRPSPPRTSVLL